MYPMDFFARQRVACQRSHVLLGCFLLSLLVTAAFIHVVIGSLSWMIGESTHPLHPSAPAASLIAIVWLAIVAGCFFRFIDVRAGGAVLAERLGASRVDTRTTDEGERRLLHATAEMAIASVTRPPQLFVLQREHTINAFVLSGLRTEPAIVISRGALDALDHEQLQSLVAHEFAHIVRGDIPLNMHLLIALSGLMAVDEIGRLLIGRHPDELLHPGVIVGYLLRGLGSAGLLSGLLLRAAFSRQREYLADASAVQFTRNPAAMAALLGRIRDEDADRALHCTRSEELAHLCIHDGRHSGWYRRLFASHPPLARRIGKIDPHFEVRRRVQERRQMQRRLSGTDERCTAATRAGAETGRTNPGRWSPGGPTGALAKSTPLSVSPATGNLAPPAGSASELDLLLPDVPHCIAAVALLFTVTGLTEGAEVPPGIPAAGSSAPDGLPRELSRTARRLARRRLQGLTGETGVIDLSAVDAVMARWFEVTRYDERVLIDHVASALASRLSLDRRQSLLMQLEQLVSMQNHDALLALARVRLLRRLLDAEFPLLTRRLDGQRVVGRYQRIRSFDAMGAELAVVLSLLVEASATQNSTAESLNDEYLRALRCYTSASHRRRCSSEPGIVHALERALQTLLNQPSPIRRALVQHCEEIMHRDGRVTPREASFVAMLAEILECRPESQRQAA